MNFPVISPVPRSKIVDFGKNSTIFASNLPVIWAITRELRPIVSKGVSGFVFMVSNPYTRKFLLLKGEPDEYWVAS